MNDTAYHNIKIGDKVTVLCHDEGYVGRQGVVVAVFQSGRCQVAIGPIVLLNITPEGIKREVSNRQVGEGYSEEDGVESCARSTDDTIDRIS